MGHMDEIKIDANSSDQLRKVVDRVQAGEQVHITRDGELVAVAIHPKTYEAAMDALADHTLATAPEYKADREQADREIAAGNLGTPLADVMAELDAEDGCPDCGSFAELADEAREWRRHGRPSISTTP